MEVVFLTVTIFFLCCSFLPSRNLIFIKCMASRIIQGLVICKHVVYTHLHTYISMVLSLIATQCNCVTDRTSTIVMLQSTTGTTTLTAEDKLDDQTLIKLKILIDEEEVCRFVCMAMYMCALIKLLAFCAIFIVGQCSV